MITPEPSRLTASLLCRCPRCGRGPLFQGLLTVRPSCTGCGLALARFDTGYNPMAGVSERRLTDFPNLWAYARDLYQRPAFRDTTDFTSFGGLTRGPKPSFLNDGSWRIKVEPRLADWDTPSGRERLG